MSYRDPDFAAARETLRRCGTHGGTPTGEEMLNFMACSKRLETLADADSTLDGLVQAAKDDTVAQFDILDAFTGSDAAADIVAAIATASTLLRADTAAAAVSSTFVNGLAVDGDVETIPALDGTETIS